MLFVCLGNIVRSPLAEGLFNSYSAMEGLSDVLIADSAGTSGWHVGEQPDRRMLRVASENNIFYSHRSRQITLADLDLFDLIVAMDRENFAAIFAMAKNDEQRQKVHLLMEWGTASGRTMNVPDPYYGNKDGFIEVFHMIERSVRALLDQLKNDHS